jgi:UDP-N-acetylmuramoyl-tripeptide--D-alanyl-D-alanine ligase
MISGLLSLYKPSYISSLVYMLQSTEYRALPYLKWYWRTSRFDLVAKRRKLDRTLVARVLWLALAFGMLAQIVLGAWFIRDWYLNDTSGSLQFGVALILSYPVLWAHLVVLPLALGRWFIIKPKEMRRISQSKKIFGEHTGVIIAVAGSYGKTTMKELLLTVLSEGKNVAATPANRNVATSHAAFARKLKGDEDILVIEYGEGRPGDVKRFSRTTQPDIGVITGLAPAHLDQYKSLERAGKDIFALADFLHDQNVYVNGESESAKLMARPAHELYSASGVAGWKISDITVTLQGTSFKMTKDKTTLDITSGLIGRHLVGPLATVAAIAKELGLTKKQIEAGMAKTKPFEHRMEYRDMHGAAVLDDTYNGNIDGMKAGLQLLKELPATRKLYITPGLVDQGSETKRIHHELGEAIARAKPDIVVLMQNSVTNFIVGGIQAEGFKGELRVEFDPLQFYTNLDVFVAAGDLILMQNDWTDNYA